MIQLPHKTRSMWKITATSQNADLSICALRVAEGGWCLPCLDTKIKANVTEHHPETADGHGLTNKVQVLDLGYVTNICELPKTNDSTFANHTLRIEVLVSASADVTAGGTLGFKIETDTSGDDSNLQQILPDVSLTVIDPITPSTENTSVPEFNFYVMPVGGDTNENLTRNTNDSLEVAKGEAVQFRIDIKSADLSTNKLVVKYLTPVNTSGIMEVTDITVTHVGANFPCVDRAIFRGREEPVVTRTDAVYSDLADIRSMDLGFVCHYPHVDEEDPTADIITVEGIMRVFTNAPVEDGATEWASVTVRINEDQIYVAQMLVTIRDDLNETVYDKTIEELVSNYSDPNDPWIFKPAERYTIPFIVTVAENQTIKAMIDAKMPVNETAVGVVEELRLVKAGRNLAMLELAINRPDQKEADFVVVYTSSLNNTQNDGAFIDIGIVTNTGVTSRRGDFEEADNQFVFEADIWVADAAVFEDNSTHWLSAGAKIGSVITILDTQVIVDRDLSERPDLCISASLNTSEVTQDNTPAEVVFTIQHTNMSKAEAYNVSVAFYFTGFLDYSEIQYCNISDTLQTTPEVTIENAALRKVKFTFDRVLFTDNVYCVVTLTSNDNDPEIPSSESGTGVHNNASTPYEGLYQMIYRQNGVYEDGHWFYNTMAYIDPDVVVPGGVACDQYVLGMSSGTIQDCQITGSYSPDPDHQPHDARLNTSTSWKPSVRQSFSAYPRYIDVALGNITKVTKIHIGIVGSSAVVAMAKVLYSMDGVNWDGNEAIANPTFTGGVYVHTVSSPQEARHVRILLQEATVANPQYEVRFELEGCILSGDVTPSDVCTTNEWEYNIPDDLAQDYYPRGFIADVMSSRAYICDLNPNVGKDFKWTDWNSMVNENAQMRCYYSADGDTYNAVDEMVINVIGYYVPVSPDENAELFAIDSTKRALLVSEDGENWMSCEPSRLQKRRDAPITEGNFKEAAKLDWTAIADTPQGTLWTGKTDGMYYSGTKKLDWSVCCL